MTLTLDTTSSTQKLELVNSFAEKIEIFCIKRIQNIYGKNINFNREDIANLFIDFKDICFDSLYDCFEKWDPKHPSGANLFTFAMKEIKHRLLLETNKGMTENEIKNNNIIHKAKKKYAKKFGKEFYETESSIIELSKICGLSVKVIKNTLLLKREMNNITRPLSFSKLINENGDDNRTYESFCGDMTHSPERQLEIKCLRQYLSSLTTEENAILYTMVDKDYNLISEREGVRLLAEKNINIGRGTLNRKREELKEKLAAFYYGCAA